MNKIAKFLITSLAILTLALNIMPSITSEAAQKTYSVTFRAGNVGSFDTSRIEGSDNVEVSDNYIKFLGISRGATIAEYSGLFKEDADLNTWLANIMVVEDNYYRLPLTDVATAAVTKNTEYVIDYGRLVDPVEYTINHVDSASGNAIAAPTIAYGNAGDVIDVVPLTTIAGYTSSVAATTMTLTKDANNVATITYTSTATPTVVDNIITTVVPGGAAVVPGAAVAPAADAGADADADAVITDDDVPLAGDDNQGDNANNADGGDGGTTITDDPTPRAGGVQPNTAIFIAIVVVVVIALAILIVVFRRRQAVTTTKSDDDK